MIVGKEHALLVSNHRSDIDWLVGWILAEVFSLPPSHLPAPHNLEKIIN
jgi:1-acyl-sn-glycerol-3-phosphate acyltransferase